MTSYDDDDEALEQLRHHWGDAYEIAQTGPRTWLAARRDGTAAVYGATPDELMDAISSDYLLRPVPRDLPRACGLGCELPYGHKGLHDDLAGNKWGGRPDGAS